MGNIGGYGTEYMDQVVPTMRTPGGTQDELYFSQVRIRNNEPLSITCGE